MVDIRLEVIEDAPLALAVDESGASLTMQLSDPYIGGMLPAYGGEYTAVPTRAAQVFSTENTSMLHDFTVQPIPSNYGLIEYDGSVMTVS